MNQTHLKTYSSQYLLACFAAFIVIFLVSTRTGIEPVYQSPGPASQTPSGITVSPSSSTLPANSLTLSDSCIRKGLELYAQHRFRESADANMLALRYNPGNELAWNNLCSCYNEMHEWEKAIDAANKAIALKPDFQLARNNLKFALENKNK
jgi:tetratricopeptide (TPR) repeat protein